MPDLAFPPVGRLGLTSPPSPVLCSATTASCPSRCPVFPRSPIPCWFLLFVSFLQAHQHSGTLVLMPGLLDPGTPFPGCLQGDKRLSQVPRLPLCAHALLSDPGGDLLTHPSVLRSAAFHQIDGVGFPVLLADGYPLGYVFFSPPLSTTIDISRLNHTACTLALLGSRPSFPSLPARFASSLLVRL